MSKPQYDFSDLLHARYVKGCELFREAITALTRNDIAGYESALLSSAIIGIGAIEQLMKIHLDLFCRAELSPGEIKKLDGSAFFPNLLDMMERANPPLDANSKSQLTRYRNIRNAAEHRGEKPTSQELHSALEKIGQLIILYLPLDIQQKHQVESALQLLSRTSLEKHLDAIEVRRLFGPAIRLVDPSRVSPASDENIRQYYEGTPLTWSIIFSGGDVERDIRNTLVAKYAQSFPKTVMLCLTGKPGAGKSTLAWRVALEIAISIGKPLLHVRDNESPDIWYNLEPGVLEYGGAVLVLVDDVFRNDQARRALETLSPDLPITIISTSRSNEIPDDLNVCFSMEKIELSLPTTNERKLVKERLAEYYEFDQKRYKLINHAKSWWAMMMEATRGENLTKIVNGIIELIKRRDPLLFRAYEYICFVGQLNLNMPEAVLQSLDEQYYNLTSRPMARGVVLTNLSGNTISTLHPSFAGAAWKIYRKNPQNTLSEIFQVIDVEDQKQRIFAATILRNLILNEHSAIAKEYLKSNMETVEDIYQWADAPELINFWQNIFLHLGFSDKVEDIENRVLRSQPKTERDWIVWIPLIIDKVPDQIGSVLDKCLTWIGENAIGHLFLNFLIGIFEKHGRIEQKESLAAYSTKWLSLHPDDTFVRTRHLGFVERQLIPMEGSSYQADSLIDATAIWLKSHPDDSAVRTAYLGLVERRGNPGQVISLIESTRNWLESHPEDVSIRMAYMGLVERKGNDEQINFLIESATIWLKNHEEGTGIRATFLGLVERKGNPKQTESLITSMIAWLENHPKDTYVRSAFLSLIERKGSPEQKHFILRKIQQWLAQSEDNDDFRAAFLSFLLKCGSAEDQRKWIIETGAWLDEHPSSTSARVAFLALVEAGTSEQISTAIEATREWLISNPQDSSVRQKYMNLLDKLGSEEQIADFIQQTIGWLANHPSNNNIRASIISFIQAHGSQFQQTSIISHIEQWLMDNPYDQEVIRSYLSYINSQNDAAKYDRSRDIAEKLLTNNPGTRNSELLRNYGYILYKLENFEQAAEIFDKVLTINKRDVRCRIGLAWSLFFMGDQKRALDELNHVLWWAERKDAYPLSGAYHQLGRYFLAVENLPLAEKYFRLEVEEAPDSLGGYWELGRVFLLRGWPGMALRALEHAQKMVPKDFKPESRQELEATLEQAKTLISEREARKKKA